MEHATYQSRVKNLYQMLFEMATGNLDFRIQPTKGDDQLAELSQLLNTLAKQMQAVLRESGYVIPRYTYQNLLQTSFILNKEFTIRSFSSDATSTFSYPAEKLFAHPFDLLISDSSLEIWKQTKSETQSNPQYHRTVQLLLADQKGKIRPCFCTVSRLLYSEKILVSTVTTILQDAFADQIPTIATKSNSDALIIQRVSEYILNHLEDPLPTTRQLSRQFGTNEFRLKEGFRHFFNTSIYQFYNDERLKRAHLLIQQTNESIKSIALSCGFNDYVNFSKAFKKKFSYPPIKLKRPL